MVLKIILVHIRSAPGFGDILHAFKMSEGISKNWQGQIPWIVCKASALDDDSRDLDEVSIRSKISLINKTQSFKTKVVSIAELEHCVVIGEISIRLIIFAAKSSSSDYLELSNACSSLNHPVPYISIDEYGQQHKMEAKKYINDTGNILHFKTYYPGFSDKEIGILPDEALSDLSNTERFVERLEPKISSLLLKEVHISSYLKNTELFLQYSHDTMDKGNPTPSDRFLMLHREFIKASAASSKYVGSGGAGFEEKTMDSSAGVFTGHGTSLKHQDIVMIGKAHSAKRKALVLVKEKLIADGFTRIVFYNVDTKEEDILHDKDDATTAKTFRVIYSKAVTHESMLALTGLSGQLIGATGDQSFGEAVHACKIPVYEVAPWKSGLWEGYKQALREAAESRGINNDLKIQLAYFLNDSNRYEYESLGEILRNSDFISEWQHLNRAVSERVNLFEVIQTDIKGFLDDTAIYTEQQSLVSSKNAALARGELMGPELIKAASEGNQKLVANLLTLYPSLKDYCDKEFDGCALVWAVSEGNYHVVEFLLAGGNRPSQHNVNNALYTAVYGGEVNYVQLLIKTGKADCNVMVSSDMSLLGVSLKTIVQYPEQTEYIDIAMILIQNRAILSGKDKEIIAALSLRDPLILHKKININ